MINILSLQNKGTRFALTILKMKMKYSISFQPTDGSEKIRATYHA
jgi:hypothetical protein